MPGCTLCLGGGDSEGHWLLLVRASADRDTPPHSRSLPPPHCSPHPPTCFLSPQDLFIYFGFFFFFFKKKKKKRPVELPVIRPMDCYVPAWRAL